MTEVKRIDGVQTAETKKVVTDPQKQAQAEKAKTNAEIQKEFFKNKEAQKAKKAELQALYQDEIGLSVREAKKVAKNEVQNEVNEEVVDKTTVFYDKDQYKKAVEADKENKDLYTYVSNKKVRKMVEAHKDDFYDENGNFSSDKYKATITKWTGEDYELNLDERRSGAKDYGFKARHMKKAAQYANSEIETDHTVLKRVGYVAGTTALGAGVGAGAGALIGKYIKKNISASGTGSGSDFVKLPIAGGGFVEVTVDSIVNATGGGKVAVGPKAGALVGAVSGGSAGLAIGLATMHNIKDDGKKDIFNGISAEEIIKNGSQGVEGKTNKKIVDAIININSISDEEKVAALKQAYGDNTGKRVNDRELIAVYENLVNQKEAPKEEAPKEEIKPPAETPEITAPPVAEVPCEDCPKTPAQEEKVIEKEIPTVQYQPKKGEYWAGIISAKYGIKGNDLKAAVHELKTQHGITNFNQNIQPKVLNLPETLKAGEKEYKLNVKAPVIERAKKFAPAKKYTGSYTNPKTQEKSTVFFYTDCNGNRSQAYKSAAERDSAMTADKVKKAA